MDPSITVLLTAAMAMIAATACGSADDLTSGGSWYERNPDPGRPVEWSVHGWDTGTLSTGQGCDYLDELEREVLLHINMARSDPSRYAEEFLGPRLVFFDGDIYREPGRVAIATIEGAAALEDCIADMEDTDPVDPMLPSEVLTLAALDHAGDLSASGETGHVGSDGSLFSARIERYGEWRNTIGEVISYGPDTGREIVIGLLIDDGVDDDGHRRNLLNPDFMLVGIAVEEHSSYGNVCVIDFAGSFAQGSPPR